MLRERERERERETDLCTMLTPAARLLSCRGLLRPGSLQRTWTVERGLRRAARVNPKVKEN